MEIIIKNLRTEKPQYEYQVRVDRQSILGNPFYMQNENFRDIVCDQYEKHFKLTIKAVKVGFATQEQIEFVEELKRLYKLLKKHHKLELFCWCTPKRCHAETIKNFLLKVINKNQLSKTESEK